MVGGWETEPAYHVGIRGSPKGTKAAALCCTQTGAATEPDNVCSTPQHRTLAIAHPPAQTARGPRQSSTCLACGCCRCCAPSHTAHHAAATGVHMGHAVAHGSIFVNSGSTQGQMCMCAVADPWLKDEWREQGRSGRSANMSHVCQGVLSL